MAAADHRFFYRDHGKRFADMLMASVLSVCLFPLAVAVAVAVRIGLGTPVIFQQSRPGRDGRIFRILKFRTMTDACDATGKLRPDRERLTALGRFLRQSSLDELPELWNVVRGEMSLVGPRPLRVEYLGLYSPEHFRRHELRSGITGWAQINGRNALDWDTRLAMDVWYVDHVSLGLDLRILLMTPLKVIGRSGIASPGEVAGAPFTGSGVRVTPPSESIPS